VIALQEIKKQNLFISVTQQPGFFRRWSHNTFAKPKKRFLWLLGWGCYPRNSLGFVPQPNLQRNGEGIVGNSGFLRKL